MRITQLQRRGNKATWVVINDAGNENHRVNWRDVSAELAEQKQTKEPLRVILERRAGYSGGGPDEPEMVLDPNTPVVTDHVHPEFGSYESHDHDQDYAGKGHEHEDVWSARLISLSETLSQATAQLARRIEGHIHDALPLIQLTVRVEALEANARQWQDHDRVYQHADYATKGELRTAERVLHDEMSAWREVLAEMSAHTTNLKNALTEIKDNLPEAVPAYDDTLLWSHSNALYEELDELKKEVALLRVKGTAEVPTKSDKLDAILAGHDLHIAGKVNVHGRGPEIQYTCSDPACGFSISLPEGVLKSDERRQPDERRSPRPVRGNRAAQHGK